MKITRILATAGLVIASLGISTAASARDHHGDRHQRYERHHRDDRWGRHDHGWHNGRGHNRCHTEWRHHRQIRVCR